MSYSLKGYFIEACDCTVICPCWVEDDPVGGHCTGLIAWHLDASSQINGVGVADRTVVSVSTHLGNRRDGTNTTTVLYVDEDADDAQFHWLDQAFRGKLEGVLKDLAEVSGTVVSCEPAKISVDIPPDAAPRGEWHVQVSPLSPTGVHVVEARGMAKTFEGETAPMTLTQTALSRELGVHDNAVVAQAGKELTVKVGALPAGSLTVLGRSGMRGDFSYEDPDHVGGLVDTLDGSPQAADKDHFR